MGHLCDKHNIFDGAVDGCPTCHEIAETERNYYAKTNVHVVEEIMKGHKEIRKLRKALEKIARVNAMDYEYQRWAEKALWGG